MRLDDSLRMGETEAHRILGRITVFEDALAVTLIDASSVVADSDDGVAS